MHTTSIARTAVTLLAVWVAVSAGLVRADPAELRSGVVKIVSNSPEGKRRTGTGFIVLLEPGVAFIVTAWHVVEGDKTPQVEFFTRPLAVGAEVTRLEPQLDVALLVVHARDDVLKGLLALRLDLAGSLAVGQDVTTIGFPGSLSWALSKPNIASQEGVHLALVGGNIDEGSSGGPVLGNGAVVAMVTAAERGSGRAIPAQFLGYVLRGWRIDVADTPAPSVPSPPDKAPSPSPAPAAETAQTWERTLGPTMAHEIHRTSDGNYILSGYTKQGDQRAFDALVVKLDQNGRVTWERRFPTGGDDDLIYSIAELVDGGYVVAGEKAESGAWVAALDASGNLMWERTFAETKATTVWRIRRAPDAGIVVAGSARSPTDDRTELWLAKLDRRGVILWSRTYWNREWGDTGYAIPFALRPSADGGYLIAAANGWVGRVWLLKLAENGDVQWQRDPQPAGNVFDIRETQGGYVVAGAVKGKDGRRAWLARLDRNGRLTWQQQFDASKSENFYTVSETADGGYLAAGQSIVKLNARGELIWKREFEGETGIVSIERTPDGGYIAGGVKNGEVWVLKLDADARLGKAM
jgi:hypothetical protein